MNAPLPRSALPPSVLKALTAATLDDKYTLPHGQVFMSGVQALVRLPLLQHARDAAAGLDTAGFISGYRGSPLGGYDQALWHAREHLASRSIVFQPGVNEELAATAVWGSQQLDLYPDQARFDGVFGLWYAKGPGVDRSCDVLKHANMAGTSRYGGVIAVAGDDHVAKSSSLPHQSDHIFKACGLPVFFPSSVQEILDLGLHAWAMSRFSGLWSGLKTIQEVVESAASVEVEPERVRIVIPRDFELPAGGLHIRWPDTPLEQEARMMTYKWYAALAYVRANRLNHTVIDSPRARLGLIASGKAYNDLRQALHDLGLTPELCAHIGLRVHKVNVVWPLEASITREFAQGLQEILVVEEKRQMIEYQLKEELYNWREDVRPNVLGKFNEPEGDLSGGEWAMANPSANTLLRAQADLNPALVAQAVAQRLDKLGLLRWLDGDRRDRVTARLAQIEAQQRRQAELVLGEPRPPWFCSGCPHNTSTQVPQGSRAMAGIGCHYMALWMDRSTTTFTQMGGEGVPWVGLAPFTSEPHRFANLGDGTYFHSGLLAIRQSVAAGVNITYKILYNHAVAMTGGQPVEGHLSVAQMTHELRAEGVMRIAVVSDDAHRYDTVREELAAGVSLHHRDQLDALQRELREGRGCSVLIYDQTCATELRRRRKRGLEPELHDHVMINEAVCEGCGDCTVQSNCLSVEPVETEFGTKRRINHNTCNQDFSCLRGFCPSFVTVHGQLRPSGRARRQASLADMPALPHPTLPACEQAWGIVVAGIGGTGVITLGQVLGMAAHLEGKGVITQDAAGLAQKGGATWSHVQIAQSAQAIHTTRVTTAAADVLIGCDALVAAQDSTLDVIGKGRTRLILNTHATPTATVLGHRDWQHPGARCESNLSQAVGGEHYMAFDANALAEQLLGDTLYANTLLLGFAWQKGWIPLSQAALLRAMSLNGTQVESNHDAFTWGRHAAHDLLALRRAAVPGQPVAFVPRAAPPLDVIVAQRRAYLCQYQNKGYAQRYVEFVHAVRAVEQPLGSDRLTRAVALQLFRLMAYKDEYEVARLHTQASWQTRLQGQFDGPARIYHHFSLPGMSRDGRTGPPRKLRLGPWVRPLLQILARCKGLRGTWFDPFGHSEERHREREWIDRYRGCVQELLEGLQHDNLDLAVRVAQVPGAIRGFGHIKAAAMEAGERELHALLMTWRGVADKTGVAQDVLHPTHA